MKYLSKTHLRSNPQMDKMFRGKVIYTLNRRANARFIHYRLGIHL